MLKTIIYKKNKTKNKKNLVLQHIRGVAMYVHLRTIEITQKFLLLISS